MTSTVPFPSTPHVSSERGRQLVNEHSSTFLTKPQEVPTGLEVKQLETPLGNVAWGIQLLVTGMDDKNALEAFRKMLGRRLRAFWPPDPFDRDRVA